MELPKTADGVPSEEKPKENERYIINPYHGLEVLTRQEALNAINVLSGMLLIDGIRRNRQGDEKRPGNIPAP